MSLEALINVLFISLVQGSVLALVTFAIVLIFRTSATTNFAQGMVSTFAAFFSTFLFYSAFGLGDKALNGPIAGSDNITLTLFSILSIVCAMALGFLMGFIIDVVIFRNSKFANIASKQMITLGIVLILSALIPLIFGTTFEWYPPKVVYLPQDYNWNLVLGDNFTLRIDPSYMISIILCAVILIVLFAVLKLTKWGLGVRSTAANEKVAGLLGVNTRAISSMTWAIAAGIGSIGAILYAPFVNTVGQGLMATMQIDGFLSAIIGSFGSFVGPVVVSYLLPAFKSVIRLLLGQSSMWADTVLYVVVLTVVLIRPNGFFGKKVQKKV